MTVKQLGGVHNYIFYLCTKSEIVFAIM